MSELTELMWSWFLLTHIKKVTQFLNRILPDELNKMVCDYVGEIEQQPFPKNLFLELLAFSTSAEYKVIKFTRFGTWLQVLEHKMDFVTRQMMKKCVMPLCMNSRHATSIYCSPCHPSSTECEKPHCYKMVIGNECCSKCSKKKCGQCCCDELAESDMSTCYEHSCNMSYCEHTRPYKH
jgi:hypothetical protein